MLQGSGRHVFGAALAGLAGWVILFAVAAIAEAESQVLRLNWPSQRDKDTAVTEIEMTETQIIITLRIHNRGSKTIRIFVCPPGHPQSFYIQEKATGRRHNLAGSRGLAVYPDETSLLPGRGVTCKLFFTKIPLASFSLMEGEASLRKTNPMLWWDFLNIDLAKLAKGFKTMDRPPPRPDHIFNQPSAPSAKPASSKPARKKEPLKFKYIIDNQPAGEQETGP